MAKTHEPGDLPDAVVLHPGRVHRVSEVPAFKAVQPSRNDSHRLPGSPSGRGVCVGLVAPALAPSFGPTGRQMPFVIEGAAPCALPDFPLLA